MEGNDIIFKTSEILSPFCFGSIIESFGYL